MGSTSLLCPGYIMSSEGLPKKTLWERWCNNISRAKRPSCHPTNKVKSLSDWSMSSSLQVKIIIFSIHSGDSDWEMVVFFNFWVSSTRQQPFLTTNRQSGFPLFYWQKNPGLFQDFPGPMKNFPGPFRSPRMFNYKKKKRHLLTICRV